LKPAWRTGVRTLAIGAVVALGLGLPRGALGTPSTTFWAPSTPFVQAYGVLHLTYDTYFQSGAEYPVDVGLEIGALRTKKLQLEAGFDLLYPTFSGDGPLAFPILLNAKLGAPEDAWFKGSPAWSAGIFGVGFQPEVTNYDVLHAMLGKTVPRVGGLSLGAYYGLARDLFRSADGRESRGGLMAGWTSPPLDVPAIDHLQLAWDVQTGRNVLGATGGGAYVYLTPAIDLLVGPVYSFDERLQPGASRWMWSVQFDADVDLLAR
jgi:hypothetical protein